MNKQLHGDITVAERNPSHSENVPINKFKQSGFFNLERQGNSQTFLYQKKLVLQIKSKLKDMK